MAKVDLDNVKMALQRTGLSVEEIAKILEELAAAAEADKPEKEPSVKKQYVVLLKDNGGFFKNAVGKQSADWPVGWVVQIPEDENPESALEKLHLGAYDFNRSAKGRRYPVKTVSEACEFGSAKLFKEQKIWIKTKEPVLIIPVSNKLPTE